MWNIFCLTAFITAFLLVPSTYWKSLWKAGIIGMLVLYAIDSTFVALQAFRFNRSGLSVSGLPLAYWLSSFAGGILFAYFNPVQRRRKLIYIIIMALLLFVPEMLFLRWGYFEHIYWNPLKSFLLNIGGFVIVMFFMDWLCIPSERTLKQA